MTDTIDFYSLLLNSARKAEGRVGGCRADIRRLERELQHAKDQLIYLEEEQMNIDAFVHTYTAPAREFRELTAEFEAMMDATKEAAAEIEDDDKDNCGCPLCQALDDVLKSGAEAAAAAEAMMAMTGATTLNDIGVSAGRLDDIAIGSRRDAIATDIGRDVI